MQAGNGTLQDWGPILLPKFTFFKSQAKVFLSMSKYPKEVYQGDSRRFFTKYHYFSPFSLYSLVGPTYHPYNLHSCKIMFFSATISGIVMKF